MSIKRVYRTPTSFGEIALGLSWLSFGSIISALLEVIYLTAHVTIAGVAIPLPITILVAFFLNQAITRTARLWTRRPWIAVIPLLVWVGGLLFFILGPSLGGRVVMLADLRSIGLLAAGLFGGGFPFFHRQ